MNSISKTMLLQFTMLWVITAICISTTVHAQKEEPFEIQVHNILDEPLPARIELRNASNHILRSYIVPEGKLNSTIATGSYTVYIFVYDNQVPYGVSVQDLNVVSNKTAQLSYNLLEGSGPNQSLMQFDADGDLFIGRVEIEQGTNPNDARSVPGLELIEWPKQLISNKKGWYRGELHAQSEYGRGKESVKKLIKRAESLNLDFLSILDRNTLEAPLDKDHKSKSMVLIPGLEWGNDENGVALVYAPLFLPQKPETMSDMRSYTRILQTQGALVFAGHPCFPQGVWNWIGVPFDGIQTWCMGWGDIPPINVGNLNEINQIADKITIERNDDRGKRSDETRLKFKRTIAISADTPGLSANGQATNFWDLELNTGLELAMIGGSQTATPKVPMAKPVTYVYAKDLSLDGILEGILKGRTYVSHSLDGPTIDWVGDIFDDGTYDVGMGGIVPVDQKTTYYAHIKGAAKKKLVIMENGTQSYKMTIPNNDYTFTYSRTPEHYTVYRLRIVEPADKDQPFGFNNMLLMTSPIYAKSIIAEDLGTGTAEWVFIESETYIEQNKPYSATP